MSREEKGAVEVSAGPEAPGEQAATEVEMRFAAVQFHLAMEAPDGREVSVALVAKVATVAMEDRSHMRHRLLTILSTES